MASWRSPLSCIASAPESPIEAKAWSRFHLPTYSLSGGNCTTLNTEPEGGGAGLIWAEHGSALPSLLAGVRSVFQMSVTPKLDTPASAVECGDGAWEMMTDLLRGLWAVMVWRTGRVSPAVSVMAA